MNKQTKVVIIKIDDDLKQKFMSHASDKQMTLSARIKYLMKMDIEGKLHIKNG